MKDNQKNKLRVIKGGKKPGTIVIVKSRSRVLRSLISRKELKK